MAQPQIKPRRLQGVLTSLGSPLLGTVLGLLIGAVLILLVGADPIETYAALFKGAFGGMHQLRETILKATPLLLMALGLTVAFRARVWNVGGEGQYIVGALTGGALALLFPDAPRALLLPGILVAGFLGGALWALIAGILKTHFRVNEIISTLMLNYIAVFFLQYMSRGPLNDPGSTLPESAQFSASARMPILIPPRIHLGVLIALLVTPIIYILLWRTPLGHKLRTVGSSIDVARYAGIHVNRAILFALCLSGGLAGLTGLIEATAVFTRLKPHISGGYGFSGILVALLGRMHPLGAAVAAIFFAALIIGAQSMHVVTGLPDALADAIQAIIVLAVLAINALLDRRVD